MITKTEILERAREWELRPEVVEKDYVLGWLLAAVATDHETSSNWVLKGGTCIKKCFLETYRFSEDLDFTLVSDATYSAEGLREVFRRIARRTADLSGIDFDLAQITIKERHDKLDRTTFEGRIGYQGPLRFPGWPRALFDLTNHEVVVDDPILRQILHPYPDELPADTLVTTYSFEELLAEKARALYERCRPRDLYDVVYVVGNATAHLKQDRARGIWEEKCRTKGFPPPTPQELASLVERSEELRADWAGMLAHQLPQLPPIADIVARLPDSLLWLTPGVVEIAPRPSVRPVGTGEQVLAPASVRLWGVGVPLEVVRFAGANRLIVGFDYDGKARLVEPYSLRRASTGNVVLYAWELASNQIKAFNVAKIQHPRATDQTFVPRFSVELSAGVGLDIAPLSVPTRNPRVARPRRRRVRTGPIYVFQCATCGKQFRRKKNNSRLRHHTYPNSSATCPSRHGYLVRMQ